MDDPIGLADALEEETSRAYLGRWNRLVSSTNWEKGRIIAQWRAALIASGASPTQYSDETWSRRVGNVSGQHVGRLRRVFERFGEVQASYDGLFWSHFQAAIDWNDAEMWLEGAVQNGWSVSEMRNSRWVAQGAPDGLRPRDEDVIVAELDEDAAAPGPAHTEVRELDGAANYASGPDLDQGPDFGDEPNRTISGTPYDGELHAADETAAAGTAVFQDLPELPPDLADAFEGFKLAILRHRVSGFGEVSREAVVAHLDALRALVYEPV